MAVSLSQLPPSYVLLTQKEAAEYASVGLRTIERANADDELRSIGKGRMRRIRVEWIDEWLDDLGDEDDER